MSPSNSTERLLNRSSPPTLPTLACDILIASFSYLGVEDILHVRMTCKSFHRITKDKLLWVYLLRNIVIERNVPLPPCLKPLATLNAEQMEALTRRISRLSYNWDDNKVRSRSILSFDQPRSVTWLQIVSCRFLFVASSDSHASSFACWDIRNIFQGLKEPVAESFFPGPIHTAQVEIQHGAIVIALSVESRSPVVEVISLRKHEGCKIFVQLAHLPGYGHSRLLCGDFIGCAQKDNVSIPNLVNWHTKDTYPLADFPDVHGATVAMILWRDYLVIIRPRDIQLYSMPSLSNPPSLLRTLPFRRDEDEFVWQAMPVRHVDLAASLRWLFPASNPTAREDDFFFLVTIESDVHLYSLGSQTPLNEESFLDNLVMQSMSHCDWARKWDRPTWSFLVGATGHRITWLSEGLIINGNDMPPNIFASTLNGGLSRFSKSDETHQCLIGRDIDISNSDQLPATWALLKHDFDEALGILALGNTFGELAICDYVDQPATNLWSMMPDFTVLESQETGDLVRLSKEPVPLDVPSIAYLLRRHSDTNQSTGAVGPDGNVSMAREDIPAGWTNNWAKYVLLKRWEGFPNDAAWSLHHKWNVLGQPQLLMYNSHSIFFRAGGLYYIWGDDHHDVFVFQANIGLPDILDALGNDREDDLLASTRPLPYNWCAESMGETFTFLSTAEMENGGKDRRREQMDRGGQLGVTLFKKTKKSTWILANSDHTTPSEAETDSDDTAASETTSSDSDSVDEDESVDDGNQSPDGQEGTGTIDGEYSSGDADADNSIIARDGDHLQDEQASADCDESDGNEGAPEGE